MCVDMNRAKKFEPNTRDVVFTIKQDFEETEKNRPINCRCERSRMIVVWMRIPCERERERERVNGIGRTPRTTCSKLQGYLDGGWDEL